MAEFYSGSAQTAKFDKRNPLQLVHADEEELDADEVLLQQDIEGSGPKAKKHGVRLDFDSDSSDDGKTRRLKNSLRKEKEDSEDDMFGGPEDDPVVEDGELQRKEAKKKAEFMDMDKFENEGRLEVRENDTDGEGDDDDEEEDVNESNVDIDYFVNAESRNDMRGIKNAKKTEPKIEAFHLREDLEEGNFDKEGNFIRNTADGSLHQDQWLTGLTKHDMKAARRAHLDRQRQEDEVDRKFVAQSDLLGDVLELLQISETPLEALQRLNQAKIKMKNKKAAMVVDPESEAQEQQRKVSIEVITECCSRLMEDYGMAEIYDLSREELLRHFQQTTGEPYQNLKRKRSRSPSPDRPAQWEFKWTPEDEIHGPHSTEEIKGWIDFDYFDEHVLLRRVGAPEFLPWKQVPVSE